MVEHLDPAGLHRGMLIEDRADQALVPVPVALTRRRGMQPDPAAARTDVLLQGGPLVGTQQVTGLRSGVGVVEGDGLEAGEIGVIEDAWLRARLAALDDVDELTAILADSWRQVAPRKLQDAHPELGRAGAD
jgi:hypothetical protein